MKTKTFSKLFLLLALGGLIVSFFIFDLTQYFSLSYIKDQQAAFSDYYQANPAMTIAVFSFVYVIVTGASLPGAAILTLVAGALFGVSVGTLIVSFASTIGATLAFLMARFLLKDWVQHKFQDKLKKINEGVEREGAFYLFALRLIPVFPFFLINIVMGLTTIKTFTFFWVSQLGMLLGTVAYVNAGTQLSTLDSLQGILSPNILLSFVLLAIVPFVGKAVVGQLRHYQAMKSFKKPKSFDYNLVVIGAGSGGLVSAYIAAAVKAKVALIEKHKMGGDCLNTGCVPSKALIQSAKIKHLFKKAEQFGLTGANVTVDFPQVMKRVHSIIQKIEPHDSVERYQGLGVDCIEGGAEIISPYEVKVNGQVITAKNIIIATGARPFVPPIEGIQSFNYLTSDNVWELNELPKRLTVLGGGPIGCELAQSFARLGSKVTLVEMLTNIMIREDKEVSELMTENLKADGVTILTQHQAQSVEIHDGEKWLVCDNKGQEVRVSFDELLVAIGRQANVTGFGLEKLNVELTERGTIQADPFLRTNFPNIFVVGDVTGPYQFTHASAHQAWYAAVNALFGSVKKFAVDYRVMPWCTFTDPEVARVGLNEQDAQQQNIAYEVTRYGIDDLDRAITDSTDHGWVKVLTVPGKDKILGVTIVGQHAGELIAEFVLAMKHGLGLNKILGTIHIYPTMMEANKYVAGQWKKQHAPEGILKWLEKYHTWLRG